MAVIRKRRATVLIIEKQPNYTQLLVKQVMFAGLNPIVAVTGEGGLRKAMEHHPDLILLELDLTDMDGLEFVSLLKEKPRLQDIPIVAMSIFSYLKTAALYGGCDAFLKKPVKMIDLMFHIRQRLHAAAAMGDDSFRVAPAQITAPTSLPRGSGLRKL